MSKLVRMVPHPIPPSIPVVKVHTSLVPASALYLPGRSGLRLLSGPTEGYKPLEKNHMELMADWEGIESIRLVRGGGRGFKLCSQEPSGFITTSLLVERRCSGGTQGHDTHPSHPTYWTPMYTFTQKRFVL